MAHEWKIGDWASGGVSKKRWLIVKAGELSPLGFSLSDGAVSQLNGPNITHLPDCTGWDWVAPKPIEPETAVTPVAKSDIVGTGLVLIPWYSILAIGKVFIEGLRYGRDNWKNGVGDKKYQEERLEHAMLHLLKWKEGDRTEAHLAKVAWFCITQLELERLEG